MNLERIYPEQPEEKPFVTFGSILRCIPTDEFFIVAKAGNGVGMVRLRNGLATTPIIYPANSDRLDRREVINLISNQDFKALVDWSLATLQEAAGSNRET